MQHGKPLLILALLMCAPLAGCLESSEGESVFDLVVEHATDKGMIVETYDDGNLVSLDPLVIHSTNMACTMCPCSRLTQPVQRKTKRFLLRLIYASNGPRMARTIQCRCRLTPRQITAGVTP